MNARKSTLALSLIACGFVPAAGALLPGASALGAVIVSDSFTLNDSDREAGDGLNGVTAEVGGVWEAGGSMVFSAAGDITLDSSSGSVRIASVAIGGPDALDSIVSVTADLNPTNIGNVGVGFTADHGGFNGSNETNLWVSLTNGGTLALRQNGNAAVSQTDIGNETYFNESALNTVTLTVDRVTSLVDVVVNGTTVFDNVGVTFDTAEAYLARAGFQFTNLGVNSINGPRADNFEVTSVPEPVSLGLVLPAAIILFGRRRDPHSARA